MKFSGKILKYLAVAGIVCLCGGGWYYESIAYAHKEAELKQRIKSLEQSEKKSVVASSISAQLQDIAQEQAEISETRLRETDRLKKQAEDLYTQSEHDKEQAVSAKNRATEALSEANKQRAIAEANQRQAEQYQRDMEVSMKRIISLQQSSEIATKEAVSARKSADTLAYQALAQALATLSGEKAHTGNKALSAKLAYLSYVMARDYNSDYFSSGVFTALTTHSPLSRLTPVMVKGGVNKMANVGDNLYVLGGYGDFWLMRNFSSEPGKNKEPKLSTLLSGTKTDLRGMLLDEDSKKLFAVAYDGTLFCIENGRQTVVQTSKRKTYKMELPSKCIDMVSCDKNYFIIVGRQGLWLIDKRTNALTLYTPFHSAQASKQRGAAEAVEICASGLWEGKDAVIDSNGQIYMIEKAALKPLKRLYLPARPTFMTWKNGMGAVGCKDGSIMLQRNQSTEVFKGHSSTVSSLIFSGDKLYSASYDGNIIMWRLKQQNKRPLILHETASWIRTMGLYNNQLYYGGQHNNVGLLYINVPDIARSVRNTLTSDITREEWDEYVGSRVPYRSLMR
ncbi:MAG: hypothetical protein HUK08_02935 [Bacteroidaceae bacterium]|nr:hypothetical protein [Bacteroidaceae bacterium]